MEIKRAVNRPTMQVGDDLMLWTYNGDVVFRINVAGEVFWRKDDELVVCAQIDPALARDFAFALTTATGGDDIAE